MEIIADHARCAAVVPRRFFALIHSNDPDIRFESVGAVPVMRNSDEWLGSNHREST
ncbi:hypothetical protein [Streptomyces sp. MUM 178J]|uniref:hypothetical protein n=1 Tax=Streptomyces sp. MUM 178J TaxID=2791991 RepID=UPI001F035DC6|nr:hypothetical protein [Streptomyces sp. MUM 178J]WRQ81949.1 hypothetical protein I3F59_022715 [Streptomyces sp. MUM 178J]